MKTKGIRMVFFGIFLFILAAFQNRVYAAVPLSKDSKVDIFVYAMGYYHNWDGVSNVAQFKGPDGDLCFAVDSEDYVTVYMTKNGSPTSEKIRLAKQHPKFGTVVCDTDGYFYLITGDNNDTDDTRIDTVFVSKYDRNGVYISTVGTNGNSSLEYYIVRNDFNTKIPFDGGCCDAAINGDILTVHYGREMYNGHQSNSVLTIDKAKMEMFDTEDFYESHSFAQRVVPVDNGFVYMSEGDAFDRSFTSCYMDLTGTDLRKGHVFDFWIKSGSSDDMFIVNDNFAHMGGIAALSDGRIAFAAQSAQSLNSDAAEESEEVFIQIYDPKMDLNSPEAYSISAPLRTGLSGLSGEDMVTNYGVKWLTSYGKGSSLYNVQIAATDKDELVVLYEYNVGGEYLGVYYIVLDSNGEVIRPAELFSKTARLNPCESPIFYNGEVRWVGNKDGDPESSLYIYALNPEGYNGVPVESISLSASDVAIGLGDNFTMKASVKPDDAFYKSVRWESSDPSVATVDENGTVTAIDFGQAEIKAFSLDGNGVNATCFVTVKDPDKTIGIRKKAKFKVDRRIYRVEYSNAAVARVIKHGKKVIVLGRSEGIISVRAYDREDTMLGSWVIRVE